MSRRYWCVADRRRLGRMNLGLPISLLLALLASVADDVRAASVRRPNILIILADDKSEESREIGRLYRKTPIFFGTIAAEPIPSDSRHARPIGGD